MRHHQNGRISPELEPFDVAEAHRNKAHSSSPNCRLHEWPPTKLVGPHKGFFWLGTPIDPIFFDEGMALAKARLERPYVEGQ